MIFSKNLFKLTIHDSDQLFFFRIVRHGRSSKGIDAQFSEIEDGGAEKTSSEISAAV